MSNTNISWASQCGVRELLVGYFQGSFLQPAWTENKRVRYLKNVSACMQHICKCNWRQAPHLPQNIPHGALGFYFRFLDCHESSLKAVILPQVMHRKHQSLNLVIVVQNPARPFKVLFYIFSLIREEISSSCIAGVYINSGNWFE